MKNEGKQAKLERVENLYESILSQVAKLSEQAEKELEVIMKG